MFTDTKALSENGVWVHLMDNRRPAYLEDAKGVPDKSKPIRIKVYGADSETFQKRIRKRQAKRIKEMGGIGDLAKMSQSEIELRLEGSRDDLAGKWADATIAWENIPGGLEFSHENAENFYRKWPAIIRQLEQDVGDIEDFIALAKAS